MNYLFAFITWAPSLCYARGLFVNLMAPWPLNTQDYPHKKLAKKEFPELFNKIKKIRDDILICYSSNIPYAVSFGTNYKKSSVILLAKEMQEEPDAAGYLCKHEICHIKNFDSVISYSLATLTAIVSAYGLSFIRSYLPWQAIPLALLFPAIAATILFNQVTLFTEKRADCFANQEATDRELKGMERLLQEQIAINKKLYQKYPGQFNSDGNESFFRNLNHPSLSYRLEKVQEEIKRRGIETCLDVYQEWIKAINVRHIHYEIYKNFFRIT